MVNPRLSIICWRRKKNRLFPQAQIRYLVLFLQFYAEPEQNERNNKNIKRSRSIKNLKNRKKKKKKKTKKKEPQQNDIEIKQKLD